MGLLILIWSVTHVFHVHHRIVFLEIGQYLVILFLDYVQSGGRVAFQGLLYSFSIAFKPEDYCWQF